MSEQPKPPFDDDGPDRDELEDFLFYRKLEENGGRPPHGMLTGGCFFILPLAALLAAALYFLLTKLY